ncbi:MAG TPA: hypothetical protein VN213_04495 [Solirubrobacteraceae bacterium]|nr:hypothetical protein [Solirubrobacteraceae bacterium]
MALKDLITCSAALLVAVCLLVAVAVPVVAGSAPPLPVLGTAVAGVAVIAGQGVHEKRRRERRRR